MLETLLEELKRFVEFGDEDAALLGSMAEDMAPYLTGVAEKFYDQIRSNKNARAVFTGGEEQIKRQRVVFMEWLREVFGGVYDAEYYTKRLKIGETHVRVGLDQHYMFSATELVRRELSDAIRQANSSDADKKIIALSKLLSIDLAVMMESYEDTHAQNIRETERSAVEEKLTRAEHLAEIGQLAASLAHEIKNPLAGISGAIQIIGDSLGEQDPHRPIIKEILSQISRLDAAVKDLLVYARPTPPRDSQFDLDKVIRRVLTILHEEPALQKVRIKYNRLPNMPEGHGDEAQIEQLMMNLIINAADASPLNGSIRVYTTFDEGFVTFAVQDNGHGMSPEVRARAFEPFYTTKAKGTGLGLSICRRIIDAHHGKVSLDSGVGEGTTVVVSLPRAYPEG